MRRPTIEWQVCGVCNYDCSYCIQSKVYRVGHPSPEQVEGFLGFFAALPGRWEVKMTGGEPFAFKGFMERIVPGLVERTGHTVSVLTNLSAPWSVLERFARLTQGRLAAKYEIAGWPVIGQLARRHGAIFVERDRRGRIETQIASLDAALERGAAVIVFPEGTTGPGTHLLPFRSSLLARAAAGKRPVQPVAIRYCRRDGQPLSAKMLRKVAWLDDDALLPHAMALAASGGLAVEVSFAEPITSACRKALAEEVRTAIAARLSRS